MALIKPRATKMPIDAGIFVAPPLGQNPNLFSNKVQLSTGIVHLSRGNGSKICDHASVSQILHYADRKSSASTPRNQNVLSQLLHSSVLVSQFIGESEPWPGPFRKALGAE
ncbi:MAG: hypothetical protein ABH859_06320, partial [Pseudomonadota bacterium]